MDSSCGGLSRLSDGERLAALYTHPLVSFGMVVDQKPEDNETLEVAVTPDQLWANINRPGDWNDRHTHGSTKLRSRVVLNGGLKRVSFVTLIVFLCL